MRPFSGQVNNNQKDGSTNSGDAHAADHARDHADAARRVEAAERAKAELAAASAIKKKEEAASQLSAAIQAASLANIEQLEDAITSANEEGVNTHTANKVCALRSWLPVHPTNSRATVIESPAPGLVGMASCQCVQPLPVTPRGVLGQYC